MGICDWSFFGGTFHGFVTGYAGIVGAGALSLTGGSWVPSLVAEGACAGGALCHGFLAGGGACAGAGAGVGVGVGAGTGEGSWASGIAGGRVLNLVVPQGFLAGSARLGRGAGRGSGFASESNENRRVRVLPSYGALDRQGESKKYRKQNYPPLWYCGSLYSTVVDSRKAMLSYS